MWHRMCRDGRNSRNVPEDREHWSRHVEEKNRFPGWAWWSIGTLFSPRYAKDPNGRESLEIECSRENPNIPPDEICSCFDSACSFLSSARPRRDCWYDAARSVCCSCDSWPDEDDNDAEKWSADRLRDARRTRRPEERSRCLHRLDSDRFVRASRPSVDRDWCQSSGDMFSPVICCNAVCRGAN